MAMVSDLGAFNLRLWKSLGININANSFTNPVDSDRQIYVLADAHLKKLIRNHFPDSRFMLADGKFVNSSCVRELVMRSTHDLKVNIIFDH